MTRPRPQVHTVVNTNANLLVALDALVRACSVTEAAKIVGITQSSMSGVLKQLRTLFDDPLLVRSTGAMEPTPLALRLAPSVRRSMELLDDVLAGGRSFDPATSRERLVLTIGDRSGPVLLPRLVTHLRQHAPGITLQVLNWNRMGPPPGLATGEVDVGVGIMVPRDLQGWSAVSGGHDSAHHSEALYDGDLVSVARSDHPRVARRLTLRTFCELEHVLVTEQPSGRGIVDDLLERLGRKREVVVRVPTHALALGLVAQSDLIATVDARIARIAAATGDVRVFKTPVDLPDGQIGMAWHERTHRDAARVWLRERIRAVVGRK